MQFDEWEDAYRSESYFWGTEPSRLARKTTQFTPANPDGMGLLDVGAGEGRDAVYFAEQGFDVFVTDISVVGLRKAVAPAEDRGVSITPFRADVNDLTIATQMDVVFSSGTVHFIRPNRRERQFGRLQDATTPGGLHAMFAFVDHPDVPPAPDMMDDASPFGRDELQGYYEDWDTLHSEEIIFEDDAGGVPHEHSARILIARAPDS